jgi:hypothetical protein
MVTPLPLEAVLLGKASPPFIIGDACPLFGHVEDIPPSESDTQLVQESWGIAVLFIDPHPTAAMMERVRNGALRIGIVPVRPHGWMWMLDIDGCHHVTLAFTPALLDGGLEDLSFLDGNSRLLMGIFVLDAELVVRTGRRIELPEAFSRTLQRLRDIAAEHQDEFSPEEWDAEWDHRLPDLVPGDDPFRYASIVTTMPALRGGSR